MSTFLSKCSARADDPITVFAEKVSEHCCMHCYSGINVDAAPVTRTNKSKENDYKVTKGALCSMSHNGPISLFVPAYCYV